MIDRKQAERLAEEYLTKVQDEIKIPIKLSKKINLPYGWVFFYNSKEYIETENISSALLGNAPFIIDAADGTLTLFGTAHPVEFYLQEYEQSRHKP
ncbi:YrhB domain-containing protein [Variovorax sp. JS1663]|uniref:YrhB domain-containing protein n=1 Tax=Variovorax sp. JS1663 TaxID=1851577 RepID=UPI000B3489DD|nr:YrhB domain-containing protein [Variovorax sp. JS1663]